MAGSLGGGESARAVLDGQLEGDVHLGFFSQRHDLRKLYNLRGDTCSVNTLLRRRDNTASSCGSSVRGE